MARTRYLNRKVMFLNRDCPTSKGESWIDENGKLHEGLLRKTIRRAKRKGFTVIVFFSKENSLKTIINLRKKLY